MLALERLKERNTVTKPPSDVNVVCQDAVTRERGFGSHSDGICGQIWEAWIVVIYNAASLLSAGGDMCFPSLRFNQIKSNCIDIALIGLFIQKHATQSLLERRTNVFKENQSKFR